MDPIYRAYYFIILEDVLNDESIDDKISSFPPDVKEMFINIKEKMEKAKPDMSDAEKAKVNSEVNKYRDQIMAYAMTNIKKIPHSLLREMDSVLFALVDIYTKAMGGVNTGY